MPAFFSRNPSSSPTSTYPPYSTMAYQNSYPVHTANHRDDFVHGYNSKQSYYKAPNPNAPMFQPHQQQHKVVSTYDYSQRRQEQPVVLPSIHTYDPKYWASRIPEPEPIKVQDEPAAGGLVKHLDYDIQVMADFLHEMTLSMYALRERARDMLLRDGSTVTANRLAVPDYREWLRHVLSATRLPSTTIFIALNNLVKRLELLPPQPAQRQSYFSQSRIDPQRNDVDPKRMFIVALIISSKYADDSTFINRSWAEVAKMDVKIINELERDWLMKIEWGLDIKIDERLCRQGWEAWQARFKVYQIQRQNRDALASSQHFGTPIKLTSVDPETASTLYFGTATPTHEHLRLDTMNHSLPSHPEQGRNGGADYYEYNDSYPWNPTPIDHSPESAPYTGPTTPEYYSFDSATSGWRPNHYEPRREITQLPAQWAATAQPVPPRPQPYGPSHFNAGRPDEYSYPWNSSSYAHQHHGHCAQYPFPPPGLPPPPANYYNQAVIG